jgi:hypothetical protein
MTETSSDRRSKSTTSNVRGSLARACFVACAALLAACGGDSTGPNAPSGPAGAYAIATINAKALPVAIFADTGFTYEVTAGTLTLTGDSKYSVMTTFRQTVPGNVSTFVDSTGGTWSLSGTTITFVNGEDASTDKAEWVSGKLTFTVIDGKATNTYVYLKK